MNPRYAFGCSILIVLVCVSAAFTAQTPSADAMDQLMAPVALYPDSLLGQMLICSTNAGKVGTLNEWLHSQTAKGTELQDAAVKAGFDASFVALVLFPDVVAWMAERSDWTAQVGKAFTADRSAVFASIQRLRSKAKAAGSLKSTPQQDVETKTTTSGEQVIVIEPSNPQVVYVPQYNPTVVYTESSSSSANSAAAGIIGFTAGIAIGAAIDNDYYYGPYGWRGGGYMYNDAWDDYYDHREDAREDWMDHREDLYEERGEQRENLSEERSDRAQNAQQQRTERTQNRQTPEAQAQRDQRRTDAQAAAQNRSAGTATATGTSQEARGSSRDSASAKAASRERSGTKSDAFSGYSSGKSERAASSRGQRSRSSSGGGRRR